MKREILVFGIILLFVGLALSPSICADNGKVSLEPVPDLDCDGDLAFSVDDVIPGATLNGTITVENVGEDYSLLNWEIESYPDWGTWTFIPDSGVNLLPGNTVDIAVEIVVPEEPGVEFSGEVKLVNSDNVSDYCTVSVSLPYSYNEYTPIQLVFLLINKLRYYEGIESEENVLEIIESDAELSDIVEELKGFDCGCEDETNLAGPFPIRCLILFPVFLFGLILYITTSLYVVLGNARIIGLTLNCWWAF